MYHTRCRVSWRSCHGGAAIRGGFDLDGPRELDEPRPCLLDAGARASRSGTPPSRARGARRVALYFVVEFELSRPRWYWFDQKPVQHTQTYKITYTPLLRQYRLSVGSVYQNFTRFEEVTRVLSRLRGVHVADSMALKRDVTYQAAVRMRLDTSQLPKPFQVNAIASRDWTLTSDWHRWSISP